MQSEPVIIVAGVECAKGKEKEFNEWYNYTFPPMLIKIPGVTRIDRYERLEGNEAHPTFLSIVEVASEAALRNMAKNEALWEFGKLYFEGGSKWDLQLRWTTNYKRIYSSEG
ncbi:MAG: hypothetical protein V3V32_01730 [Dehalococcoidia bacterium]